MGESETESPVDRQLRETIRRLFEAMPADYPGRHLAMKQLDGVFRSEMAAALQPSLNGYLSITPQASIEDKQQIAAQLNADLHSLHLRPRCPKSGRPATLVATYRDAAHRHLNRFKYESRDENGKINWAAATISPLQLELIPDPPRSETFARHYGPRSRGRGASEP